MDLRHLHPFPLVLVGVVGLKNTVSDDQCGNIPAVVLAIRRNDLPDRDPGPTIFTALNRSTVIEPGE